MNKVQWPEACSEMQQRLGEFDGESIKGLCSKIITQSIGIQNLPNRVCNITCLVGCCHPTLVTAYHIASFGAAESPTSRHSGGFSRCRRQPAVVHGSRFLFGVLVLPGDSIAFVSYFLEFVLHY